MRRNSPRVPSRERAIVAAFVSSRSIQSPMRDTSFFSTCLLGSSFPPPPHSHRVYTCRHCCAPRVFHARRQSAITAGAQVAPLCSSHLTSVPVGPADLLYARKNHLRVLRQWKGGKHTEMGPCQVYCGKEWKRKQFRDEL